MSEMLPHYARAQRIRRIVRWVSRAISITFIVLLVLSYASPMVTGWMLNREQARLRAAGEPTTLEDVIPHVPPGKPNAADVYEQAWPQLQLTEEDDEKVFGPDWSIKDGQWLADAKTLVKKNEAFLRLVEKASQIEHCAFPVDWSQDPGEIKFPYYRYLRTATKLLAIRGILQASVGKPDDALASCATALRLAGHVSLDPGILPQFLGYAIEGITAGALEQILCESNPSPAACQRLIAQFGAVWRKDLLVRALQGERIVLGQEGFDSIRKAVRDAHGWMGFAIEGGINYDNIYYLREMKRMSDASLLPWPESVQVCDYSENTLFRPFFFSVGSAMLLPFVSLDIESHLRAGAKAQTCQIALAAKIFQQRYGHLPDDLSKLQQIGFNPPLDPFTHKPYHYLLTKPGFLIWSLGPDMNDDNGRPQDAKRKKRPSEHVTREEQWDYDVPFRCTR